MKKNLNSPTKAFTLVELIIVVSIILILTMIGTVAYQTSIVRSKVSRVLSEMKTLSNALEVYRLDQHAYPPSFQGDFQLDQPLAVLTTPVPYITKIPVDPFGIASLNFNSNIFMLGYNYKDRKTTSVGMPAETYGIIWQEFPAREYILHSCGPNRVWDVMPYVEYDPTNGIVSTGDISRFGPF